MTTLATLARIGRSNALARLETRGTTATGGAVRGRNAGGMTVTFSSVRGRL